MATYYSEYTEIILDSFLSDPSEININVFSTNILVKILAGETSEAVFWLTKYPCQGAGVPLTSLALLEYASRKHSVFVAQPAVVDKPVYETGTWVTLWQFSGRTPREYHSRALGEDERSCTQQATP